MDRIESHPQFILDGNIVKPLSSLSVPPYRKEGAINLFSHVNEHRRQSVFLIDKNNTRTLAAQLRFMLKDEHPCNRKPATGVGTKELERVRKNLERYREDENIKGCELALHMCCLIARELQKQGRGADVRLPSKNDEDPDRIEDDYFTVPVIDLGEPRRIMFQGTRVTYLTGCYKRERFSEFYEKELYFAATAMTEAIKCYDLLVYRMREFFRAYHQAVAQVQQNSSEGDAKAMEAIDQAATDRRFFDLAKMVIMRERAERLGREVCEMEKGEEPVQGRNTR